MTASSLPLTGCPRPEFHARVCPGVYSIPALPLRDNQGQVSRVLGAIVMSGRRGIGGRRFDLGTDAAPRVEPIAGLRVVSTNDPAKRRASLRVHTGPMEMAKDTPALRLVVSNP